MFGRKPVIPTVAGVTWTPKTTNGKAWARYLETHIPIVQGQALELLKKAQEKQKALYDRFRRKAPDFKPGDLIHKKKSSDQVSFAAARWTGPWKILRRTNGKDTAYELTRYHEGGTRFTTANIKDLLEFKGYKGGMM
jgi:hypothetical protein